MTWLECTLAAAVLLVGTSAHAAQVAVTVEGVREARGAILVAICDRADFLKPHCAFHGMAGARIGSVAVTLSGVPPGRYAAQAFHDANGNGRLDLNWLGMPQEGMGFSNDAPMRFGPPDFAAASFQVSEPEARISFRMRYFD